MTELRHVDHPDDERFDAVTIKCEERWKESEMSGDEWRFSYVVRFYRKGELVIEKSFSRLAWALAFVPSMPLSDPEDAFDGDAYASTRELCDQPGCLNLPAVFYRRLRRFTKEGEELAREGGDEYRQFCRHHTDRGDCSMDDAMHNYEEIADPREATT